MKRHLSQEMKAHNLLILFSLLIILSSCSWLYGVKRISGVDREACATFAAKANLSGGCFSCISDVVDYKKYIHCDGGDSLLSHHLSQPVQILYFQGKQLVSYHVNCCAKGGLCGLNWNTEKRFDTFPPTSVIPTTDIPITLDTLLHVYPQLQMSEEKHYTIVLFWTNAFLKISEQAWNQISSNIADNRSDCNVILINTDAFYANIF